MKNNIIKLLTAVTTILGFIAFTTTPVFADCTNICDCEGVSDEIKAASGCSGTTPAALDNVIINIINGILGVLAAVAIAVIVIGGVQFMTSAGDPGKVKRAKDTILYAAIGLIVAALAAVIVNFVIVKLLV